MRPYECVRRYWAENFPEWPVITADSKTEIFSLSQARNNAVRQAQTDVIVTADADTIPPSESVRIAVADPVGITWPHASWRLIPADYAGKPFQEFPNAPILIDYPDGLGGCMVAAADEYWRLGGQPEEFEGWGHEDRVFHMIAQTLSTFRRIGGIAYSIEHNVKLRQADSPGWNRNSRQNREKARPYEAACGKPWLMRQLLKIRAEKEVVITETGTDWRSRSGSRETDPIRRELFGPRPPTPLPQQPDWHTRWAAAKP